MTSTTVKLSASDQILQQLRPTSRGKTSYTSMNEWLSLPGHTIPDSKHVYRDVNDWKAIPTHEGAVHTGKAAAQQECTQPAEPRAPSGDGFQKRYDHLTNQIAYRWPNPGSPSLVSVYDSQKFTDRLQAQLQARPQAKPLYKQLPPSHVTTTHRASFNPYPVLPAVPSAKAPNQLQHLGRYPNERLEHCDKI